MKRALEAAQKYLNIDPEKIPDDEVPASWDWRKVEGVDFTGKVKDQYGCGSCYALSFTSALESRVKIQTGKTMSLST